MIKPSARLYAYLRSADPIYRAGQLNVWERRSCAIWSERGSFPFREQSYHSLSGQDAAR